jgi:hypothetical protein
MIKVQRILITPIDFEQQGGTMADPFVDMLEDYLPIVKTISEALRAEIQKVAPQAVEAFSLEKKHLSYSLTNDPGNEIILLAPKKDYVFLVFKASKQLTDAEGLLGGEGKQTRFMTVRSVDEAQKPGLVQLIEEAWNHAVTTTAK